MAADGKGKPKRKPIAKGRAKAKMPPAPVAPVPPPAPAKPPVAATAHDAERDRLRNLAAARSLAGRDVGPLPPVANPARRAAAAGSFELFCRSYLSAVFYLGWSPDHRKAIERIETAVRRGGLFGFAMPRGSGKTSMVEAACLWALLYGQRQFVVFIGSDADAARQRLDSIKSAIESNDALGEDFPEVCHPVRRLEGIHNRQAGQLLDGQRTHVSWTADELVLPTVAGSVASGAVMRAVGITGGIRGMKASRPHDGRSVRPDLVVPDDPQTDESARSPSQSAQRVRTLSGAVLGLAGPGKKISGFMPCTVIERGDMADQILDRQAFPAWRGERWKLVYRWPDRWDDLWSEQYRKIRADGLRAGDEGRAGTEFYRANREAMDAGGEVAWSARHNPDELSALQHAANLRFDLGDATFFAEHQNEPLDPSAGDEEALTAAQVAGKTNGRGRGEVPAEVTRVTAFVDVQKAALFWGVCGWEDDFTGYVLDYGVFPEQGRDYFALREVKRTLAVVLKTKSLEAAIYGGLERLVGDLCSRRWRKDDGTEMPVERLLVDANWGESTDVIYKFCRESPHAAVLAPSHGMFVGATSRPFREYRKKRGDRLGDGWRMPAPAGRRSTRYVLFDANAWKSFAAARLAVPIGGPGALSLFGDDPQTHKMFADHLTAERPEKVTAKGRTVAEWKVASTRAGRPDNHLLDVLVGNCVAASVQGVSLEERRVATSAARPAGRMTFKEMQAAKRARARG